MHPVSYIGEQYLGVRYVNDPLGEGRAPDTDPLIRDDAFDCTTFVETALSGGNMHKLNKIRYKNGEIDFLTRNHFIESEWLPNNADRVQNISTQFGNTATRHVVINRTAWLKRVHGIDAKYPNVTVDLEYLPCSDVCKISVKEPVIVLFIVDGDGMVDKIGTDLAVVHMGFLLPNGILRHASSAIGRVVDVDFAEYVANRAKNQHNLGIVLLGIK